MSASAQAFPHGHRPLALAVDSLLRGSKRMKAMGAQGKARVEKHFTWGKVAQTVIDGYHKVL